MPSLHTLPPVEPHGTFRWLHFAYLVRARLRVRCPQEQDWQDFATAFAKTPGSKLPLTPNALAQHLLLLNAHAWTLSRCGHFRLLEDHWPLLTPAARGAALAGGSDLHHLLDMKWISYPVLHAASEQFRAEAAPHVQWLHQRLSDSDALAHPIELTPENVLELACNAISMHDTPLLQRILLLGHDQLYASVQRMEAHARGFTWSREGEFAEKVSRLSHRVIDMILEAALVIGHFEAFRIALDAGAPPHLPIWVLERNYNEHHTALTYAIAQRDPEWADLLLQPQYGLQPHTEPTSLALYLAIIKGRHVLARQLLQAGMTFDRGHLNENFTVENSILFTCHSEDIELAQRLGHGLSLAQPAEVAWFYQGNGQGGRYCNLLTYFLASDDLPGLQSYAALGLPLRLTAPDLATALRYKARRCLPWLARQLHAPPAFMARIREELPHFHEPDTTTS